MNIEQDNLDFTQGAPASHQSKKVHREAVYGSPCAMLAVPQSSCKIKNVDDGITYFQLRTLDETSLFGPRANKYTEL